MEFFCNRRRWSGGPLREGGRRQEQYRAEPTGALREVKPHGCRCNLFVPRRSAWIFARPCIHLFQAPYEHVFGVNGHHGLFERETKKFWGASISVRPQWPTAFVERVHLC